MHKFGADNEDVPGALHQGILALFEQDPWLAFDILGLRRPVVGTPVAGRGEVELGVDESYKSRSGFPDLVLVCRRGRSGRNRRKRARGAVITIEAQKGLDEQKRWMIPVYQALLARKHELATWSIVVSFSAQMSRLIELWRTGPPPRVDSLVLDVASAPKSPWLDDPERRPTASVLVAALHAYEGDIDAARRGLLAARAMPDELRERHTMTILAALPQPHRNTLIEELPVYERDNLMEIERQSGTFMFGRQEGRREGRRAGRREGLREGRKALVELIFGLLADRGLRVDAESEAHIRACKSLAELQRWARRAVEVASVAELLDPRAGT
jgi:hypothetical protein